MANHLLTFTKRAVDALKAGGTRVNPVGREEMDFHLRPVPALGAHSDAIRVEFGGNPRSASDRP